VGSFASLRSDCDGITRPPRRSKGCLLYIDVHESNLDVPCDYYDWLTAACASPGIRPVPKSRSSPRRIRSVTHHSFTVDLQRAQIHIPQTGQRARESLSSLASEYAVRESISPTRRPTQRPSSDSLTSEALGLRLRPG